MDIPHIERNHPSPPNLEQETRETGKSRVTEIKAQQYLSHENDSAHHGYMPVNDHNQHADAATNCPPDSQQKQTVRERPLSPVYPAGPPAPRISARDRHIQRLLRDSIDAIERINTDHFLPPIHKRCLISTLEELIKNHDSLAAVQHLSLWPENKKGQTWLHLLAHLLFNHPAPSICGSMITQLIDQKQSAEAPIAAYITVLEKLQAEGGLHSSTGFKKFMDWLVCWRLSKAQPRIDLLEKIPDDTRKMRPDLPIIPNSGRKMLDSFGWGDAVYSMHDYLAQTQWIQHHMICVFMEHAPLDFVQSAIESWLEADDAAIRKRLFSQTQHPLSVDMHEPRPWNIMLAALDRLLPHLESKFSQDISKLDGLDQPVQQMDESLTDRFNLSGESFVFGRTIAFLDPKNRGHLYLKIQSEDESDSMFFKEAQRLKYFHENRDKLHITGSALIVEGVFKTDSLKAILSKYQLSYVDTARLLLRCENEDHFTILNKALLGAIDQKEIDDAIKYANKTHKCNLLAEDSPLSDVNRQTLVDYLNRNDKSCNMILLRAPAGYNYERYIYDPENHDSVVEGLISYVEEYGAMWSEGVLGPDSCSVFHDKNTRRKYYFLSPYLHRANIGTVDQWAGVSTDFPNIGPTGCRDRGDARAVSELDTAELFGVLKQGENQDTLLARGSLEALAKAAWGTILLYGRSLKETFNSNDPDEVDRVKKDVGTILGTLFSKAFHLPLEKCLECMNSQDLLAQTAREMSYWMTTDYVADLRNGLIPETVYPDYQGIRDGHVLASKQADFLSDDGFKGDYPSAHLGARNGRNPLMALDAMVVKMLTHGCLNLIKIQKAQSEMDTDV